MTDPVWQEQLERALVAGIPRYGRRRRRRVAALAAVAAGATVVLVAVGVATRTGDLPGSVETIDRPPVVTETTVGPDGPSQSPADARRDGVIPEVAALPRSARVHPMASGGNLVQRLVTPEGTWVISSLSRVSGGCLGNRAGQQGLDFVCHYSEVLLLDASGAIVRAYPFEDLPLLELALAGEAVYCGRQGDGGFPDSVLCRIDRRTGELLVRVFPWGGGPDPVSTTFTPYPWLVVGDVVTDGAIGAVPYGPVVSGPFHGLRVDGDGSLRAGGPTGPRFDAVTLEPLAPGD